MFCKFIDMMSWYPQTRLYKSKLLTGIDIFATQFIPAFLSDSFAKIKGENGKYVSLVSLQFQNLRIY